MNTDTAIMYLLADRQREIEQLRAERSVLTAECERLRAELDRAAAAPPPQSQSTC